MRICYICKVNELTTTSHKCNPCGREYYKLNKDKWKRTKEQKVKRKLHEAENRDHYLEYGKQYEAKNKEKRAQQYQRDKERRRNRHYLRKFDITLEQYNKLYNIQNGLCKICKKLDKASKLLAVDHCHKTKKIRGLLCTNCNTGIGQFEDKIELLKEVIKYLEENK